MSIDLQVGRKTTEEVVKVLRMDCCTGVGAEKTYYSYVNHLRDNVEAGQKICYQNIHLYIPKDGVMTVKVWNKKERVKVLVNAKNEDLMAIYVLVNQFQRGKIGIGKRRNKSNKVCNYCRRLGLPGTCQIKGFLNEVEIIATETGIEK